MRGVPLELLAEAKTNGDVAEQDPLGEGAGDVEIGTRGRAAFAGANPVLMGAVPGTRAIVLGGRL